MSKIQRFAIVKGEHGCFGHYDSENGDCRMCDVTECCIIESEDEEEERQP